MMSPTVRSVSGLLFCSNTASSGTSPLLKSVTTFIDTQLTPRLCRPSRTVEYLQFTSASSSSSSRTAALVRISESVVFRKACVSPTMTTLCFSLIMVVGVLLRAM